MRHYVFDESDIVKFKYCPHCGEELYSVYRGDYGGYLECSGCDRCEGFYILEEMIFREPKWLINVIIAPYERRIYELNNYKYEQNNRYREVIEEAREYANSSKILTNPAGIEKILTKALEGEEW